jgi:Septum formation
VQPGQALRLRTPSPVSGAARRGIAIAALSVALLLLSACGLLDKGRDSTPTQPTGPPGLGAGAPRVGQCRVLETFELQASSNPRPTVPCSQPHTSITIKVGAFPLREVTPANLRSGVLGDEAQQGCAAVFPTVVGGDLRTQRTSILRTAVFLPTAEQIGGSARWYRCDLIAGGDHGLPLQRLPAQANGILDGAVPLSLQACWTATKLSTGREIPCSQQHVMRAVGIAPLPDSPYPGPRVLRTTSAKSCKRVVMTWLHGRFFSGYSYEWPGPVSWRRLHVRSAVCWAVTTG